MVGRLICHVVAGTAIILSLGAVSFGQVKVDDKIDPTLRILALDPRWTVSFESPPAAPAGYDEQSAYVPLKGGELVAVALDSGEVRWKAAFPIGTTPATGDGLVFAVAEKEILALDQKTGAPIWRAPFEQPLASPLYWDAGWLIASTEAGELVAMHAEDGRVVWRQSLGSPIAVAPSPTGDRLYVALRDGRIAALELDGGTTAWEYPLKEPITGVLALEDQLLVGTRGNRLYSIDLSRGRIRWSQRAGADVIGAPSADEEHIYFVAMDNILRALDRGSGSVEWTRAIPSRPAGGPLRTGNVVLVPFVSTDIGAFDATTGAPAFEIRVAGELGGLPLGVPFLRESTRPTAPRLIAISRDGQLHGFASRFDPVPALLPDLPGIKVTGF